VLHQGGAISFALLKRIDTHERQVPMRLARVIAPHLFHDRSRVLLILLGRGALQQRDQRVFVRMDFWRSE
jgi:hypothetical protein